MRILYFILKLILPQTLRIYYPRLKKINAPKSLFGRTIYVCNHASSFMDPLVLAAFQRPSVFFMTRSDVFTKYLQPILWSVQMLPIYREQDGEDTQKKNQEVFKKCNAILSGGRNLLIFGEGFTDDVFIRRLKSVKKGAVRIGFGALEALNWEKKIYLAAVGINYADPKVLGSDVLISNSKKICLNDYKEAYTENPAKVITDLTKLIEGELQNQLTHVANKKWAFFHEQVCRLKRIGMNPIDTNFKISLKKRWENSRLLANWINQQDLDNNDELIALKADLENYFDLLEKEKISESMIHERVATGKLSTRFELLKLLLFLPIIPIGLIQFFLPYIYVKRFAEKKFKRAVFWSSIKMFLGMILMGLWNIPLVWMLNHFLIHSWLIALIYYFISPVIGMITYEWFRILKTYKQKKACMNDDHSEVMKMRNELIERIDRLIPLEFQF